VKQATKGAMTIDADGIHYKELNNVIRTAISEGVRTFKLKGVNGQRYIGTGINVPVEMDIFGIPGSDLAAFMDGPRIVVHNNAQDAIGNTMNEGEIIVHGHAGDVAGFSMRGGRVFIEGDVGYRVGIHMKSSPDKAPLLVVGGVAHDFLGEYMAGGILIVLGLTSKTGKIPSQFIGTGMHGGVIYLRGRVEPHQLGKEVTPLDLDDEDKKLLKIHLTDFAKYFDVDLKKILNVKFTKLLPLTHRPYGRLYAY